eukprot:5215497-Amphidinium_carterae.1
MGFESCDISVVRILLGLPPDPKLQQPTSSSLLKGARFQIDSADQGRTRDTFSGRFQQGGLSFRKVPISCKEITTDPEVRNRSQKQFPPLVWRRFLVCGFSVS